MSNLAAVWHFILWKALIYVLIYLNNFGGFKSCLEHENHQYFKNSRNLPTLPPDFNIFQTKMLLVGTFCAIYMFKKLSTRREALCLKFAQKSLKNSKYMSWFVPDLKETNTRRIKYTVKEVQTRTKRFEKSALPYLTHLLNKKSDDLLYLILFVPKNQPLLCGLKEKLVYY